MVNLLKFEVNSLFLSFDGDKFFIELIHHADVTLAAILSQLNFSTSSQSQTMPFFRMFGNESFKDLLFLLFDHLHHLLQEFGKLVINVFKPSSHSLRIIQLSLYLSDPLLQLSAFVLRLLQAINIFVQV